MNRRFGCAVEVHTVALVIVDGEPLGSVPAYWLFKKEDPFAVTLLCEQDDAPVTWVFARDLLSFGLTGVAGCGDVTVHACISAPKVFVDLSSPKGRCRLEMPERDVRWFLAAIEDVVPAGRESSGVDWDAELARLVA